MKKIFKKLKRFCSSSVIGLLSLIFTRGANAQYAVPAYGMPVPLYGVQPPDPERILLRLLPFLGGIFIIFVVAPIVGLIWYQKRGGAKKWFKIIVWALAMFFTIAIILFIIFVYSNLR